MTSVLTKIGVLAGMTLVLVLGHITLQPAYAASSSGSIMCEPFFNGSYGCEVYPEIAGTYRWSATGGTLSSYGPYNGTVATCSYGTMTIWATVTKPDGSKSTFSRSISCSGSGGGSY